MALTCASVAECESLALVLLLLEVMENFRVNSLHPTTTTELIQQRVELPHAARAGQMLRELTKVCVFYFLFESFFIPVGH